MRHQTLIHSEHARYHRIVFRNQGNTICRNFELKTVSFGVNCAPYLAIRTLLQLPFASVSLKDDFYVNDVLSGAHDLGTALKAQQELNEVLSSPGFSLRKLTSNSFDPLKEFPSS